MEPRYIIAAVLVVFGIAWIAFWVPRMRRMKRNFEEKSRRFEIDFGSMQALRLIRSLSGADSPETRTVYLILMRKQYNEKQGSTSLADEVWIKTVDTYLRGVVRRSPELGPKLRDFVQQGITP